MNSVEGCLFNDLLNILIIEISADIKYHLLEKYHNFETIGIIKKALCTIFIQYLIIQKPYSLCNVAMHHCQIWLQNIQGTASEPYHTDCIDMVF